MAKWQVKNVIILAFRMGISSCTENDHREMESGPKVTNKDSSFKGQALTIKCSEGALTMEGAPRGNISSSLLPGRWMTRQRINFHFDY